MQGFSAASARRGRSSVAERLAEKPWGGRTLCQVLGRLGWDVAVCGDGNGGFFVSACQLGKPTHTAEAATLAEAALQVYLAATR